MIVRHAPQEGITEDHEQSRHASSFLEICVCDFGLGIADEHLERVFEHFYRADTRLTREVYGLGLGLTVCQYPWHFTGVVSGLKAVQMEAVRSICGSPLAESPTRN